MNTQEHIIDRVIDRSYAYECGISAGDAVVAINGENIEDIFDYQYMCENTHVDITIRHKDGSVDTYSIDKGEDDDLGLVFEHGLMDEYRHCSNKCIFCFIDQMPPGMRETLYFKDDDARLSFLQGNYITLTNMSDHDVERIIKYRLSPINVSIQTMNPELRCKMLNNRFAGDAIRKIDRFYEGGIIMNGQIVLCKNVNDGEELEYSLSEMYKYAPILQSVSIVPVGMTKYREGLFELEPFNADDAARVIEQIERWQKKAYAEHGLHFVHASDEWYILAGKEVPEEERYDGYLQIENGVGMIRSMLVEFEDALEDVCGYYGISTDESGARNSLVKRIVGAIRRMKIRKEHITVITGRLAAPYIKDMSDRVMEIFPEKEIDVVAIRNDFFGEMITVSGLLTGQDIIAQCKERESLGDRIILPQCVLRADTEILLDDITVTDIKRELGVAVGVSGEGGHGLLNALL